jgi:plastocyanin
MPPSYKFAPAAISVRVGDTVTWKNSDNFTHDVTFRSGPVHGHHTVKPGATYRVTFPKAGTYRYECRFHSGDMQGKVVVR